jgi:hypothetical protein
MNVSELIELLKQYEPDKKVMLSVYSGITHKSYLDRVIAYEHLRKDENTVCLIGNDSIFD